MSDLSSYSFQPYQECVNLQKTLFHRDDFVVLTNIQALKIVASTVILRTSVDCSCWGKVKKKWKTLNICVDIYNVHNIRLTCSLFHIVHERERHSDYVRYFTAAIEIFYEITKCEFKTTLVISDGEKALISGSSEVFKPEFNLLCVFHQSQSIKQRFEARFKKCLELHDSGDQHFIFNLFHTVKWLLLLPLDLSLSILDIICDKIKVIKCRVENMLLKETRTELTSIMKYLRRKIRTENARTSPWLDIGRDFPGKFIDRSNNRCEVMNRILQVKMRSAVGPVIQKLMKHKNCTYQMSCKFHCDYYQQKTQRKRSTGTDFNSNKFRFIIDAVERQISPGEFLNLLSDGRL